MGTPLRGTGGTDGLLSESQGTLLGVHVTYGPIGYGRSDSDLNQGLIQYLFTGLVPGVRVPPGPETSSDPCRWTRRREGTRPTGTTVTFENSRVPTKDRYTGFTLRTTSHLRRSGRCSPRGSGVGVLPGVGRLGGEKRGTSRLVVYGNGFPTWSVSHPGLSFTRLLPPVTACDDPQQLRTRPSLSKRPCQTFPETTPPPEILPVGDLSRRLNDTDVEGKKGYPRFE